MNQTQKRIGIGGAVVLVGLFLYPPWHLEYEGGDSRIAYKYLFTPPDDTWTHRIGDKSVSPRSVSIAVGMLAGEVAAIALLTGFLVWLYRSPANSADVASPILSPPA